MADITLRSLHKRFGQSEVLKGVDLEIDDRELLVIVGPSGCGKSTLLRLIAGLEDVDSGEILIDGIRVNEVSPADRGVAMVFQNYALYPHMTVADNMGFSLRLSGVPQRERYEKVRAVARTLHIEDLLTRKPGALSGGERQRVAIGRAIVRNPKAFLFDEPLSNLDASLRAKMRVELARLHDELKATMIHVTHDQVEALTLADRIVILREGRIQQVGSPMEVYLHPHNQFVASFIGAPEMNLLKTTVRAVSAASVEVALPGESSVTVPVKSAEVKVGDDVTLGIRSEHLSIGEPGVLRGEVIVAEQLGADTYFYVRINEETVLTVRADGSSPTRVHDSVSVSIDATAAHLFSNNGNAIPRQLRHQPASSVRSQQLNPPTDSSPTSK